MKKIIILLSTILIFNIFQGCSVKKTNNLYDINIEYFENNTASGVMRLDYENTTGSELEELCFSLYPNAFSNTASVKPYYEEYYNEVSNGGNDYGGINIEKVTVNGEKANYKIGGINDGTLSVKMEKPLKKHAKTNIFIKFSLQIPNLNHRYGYGNDTVNLTGFYPILCVYENGKFYENTYYPSGDPFYSEVANYKLSVKVPSKYVVASSLTPTKTECTGLKTEYSFSRENVRDIAVILSEKFNIISKKVGETNLYYYYYNDKNPEKSMETIKKSFEFYSKKFIKYPYSEYVVCESDFLYGGMEYPCLTIIDDRLDGFSRDYTIAHETAHEWWYGLVGVNESEQGFLDEGLTEYSTVLFFDNDSSYGETENSLATKTANAYIDLRTYLLKNEPNLSSNMIKNLREFKNDAEYVSIAYYRSMLMLKGLKDYVGEKKFYKILSTFCGNFAYKNATYEDFSNVSEKIKKGSKGLLDGFVSGKTPIKAYNAE